MSPQTRNATGQDGDVETVAALLAQRALDDATAVFAVDAADGRRLTYANLAAGAASVARALSALGLASGETVAMATGNSLESAVALLGAMAGGFVPVPLSVTAGAAHLERVLVHCRARVVLVSANDRESVAAALAADSRATLLGLEEIAAIAVDDDRKPLPQPRRDDAALLIYTSGTTGQPRGALFSHAQVLVSARNMAGALGLESSDRFLCVVPLSHLNGFEKLLSVCCTGGRIVLADRFRAGEFWDLVVRHRCTWVTLVPAGIRQLLRHAERHPPPRADELSHLRFARSSSAPLPPADGVAFEERFGVVLAESMGMTEAGTILQNPPTRAGRRIGALGLPCGCEVRVLDANGFPVASGAIGEIAVRGPGLMTGYYEDRESTTEAVRDGWLHSSDRGYVDADGYFFHAGRAKELIIKSGVNIAPAEIDAAATTHPGVLDAAAVGVEDPYFGQDIALFVVARNGTPPSVASLRDHCEQRLGPFKTPATITFVAELPRDVAGKVQRHRLAALRVVTPPIEAPSARPRASGDGDFVAPRTATEHLLAELWREHLDEAGEIGIDDDFFLRGGSSIAAMRILSRVRRQFAVELPFAAIVEAPTIAAQARILDEATRRSQRSSAPMPVLLTTPAIDATPLFCAYGWIRYRPLAARLAADLPVYGVYADMEIDLWDPDSLWGTQEAPWPTLVEMARQCVAQTRAVQAHGPYRLAGHSFGGLLALEMAHQLRAGGEEVSLLAILDTILPGAMRLRRLDWLTHHARESLRRGPSYIARSLRERLRRNGRQIPAAAGGRFDAHTREWGFRRGVRARFAARPYDGRIVLFRATPDGDPTHDIEPHLGWGSIATGRFEEHAVAGGHQGILHEPHVGEVAAVLRRYLTGSPHSSSTPWR